MSSFKTLKSPATAFFVEKASKFHAFAYPISVKEEVKELIDDLKLKHPKANHFCTAFSIGQGDEEYHLANDDGEPSNSAGAPILGQIKSFGLTNVLIVVVRYFGGTKLGVGGLISAYKNAAKAALEEATFQEKEVLKSFSFEVAYQNLGAVLSILDKNRLEAQSEHGTTAVKFNVSVNEQNLAAVIELFQALELEIEMN